MEIPENGLIIGRAPFCDLQLSDEFVSAKHCRISFENGYFFVEDLGSTNGTFIDGTEIAASSAMPLAPGQDIQIGVSVLKIRV
jgi:pSer/pThr/pTyr-binding forkhead associated (FHA) protein